MLNRQVFRAYDIRGIVDESLDEGLMEQLGQALATTIQAGDGLTKVIIGRDGRLSGLPYLQALAKGLQRSGCDVIDIGLVPTPLVYFAAAFWQVPNAVMITGSHNPPNYNGLKIIADGHALHGAAISALADKIEHGNYASGRGTMQSTSIVPDYLKYVTHNVQLARPLKVVVDCGNGAAGPVAQVLFDALGCQVIPLFCDIDGTFPNHHPDPGDPANLQALIQAVATHQADIGLAFDGDGDRLGIVDSAGKIIWPDRYMMLFAEDVLARNPNATILYDVKCSPQLAQWITQKGGQAVMWKTGHSLIKAKMQDSGAMLAGEMSGHIFFKDRWFGFDDGLYAAARLLEVISRTQVSTASLFAQLPESISTPEMAIPISEDEKFSIMQQVVAAAKFDEALISTIDGLRVEFGDGWGLLRPSNTMPKLVARFEGQDVPALQRIQLLFKQLIHQVAPDVVVPF